jgi:hypothetical protein
MVTRCITAAVMSLGAEAVIAQTAPALSRTDEGRSPAQHARSGAKAPAALILEQDWSNLIVETDT